MSPKIQATFWSDPDVEKRTPEMKLALLWILTSPYTNFLGVCERSPRRFAFDTGLDQGLLDKTLEACAKMFVVAGDKIWIKNFIAYQYGRGEKLAANNIGKALSKGLQALPEPLRAVAFDQYPELKPLLSPSQGLRKPYGDQHLPGVSSTLHVGSGAQKSLPLASPCQGERTEQNSTAQNSTGESEGDAVIPTVEELIAFGAGTSGVPESYCRHFHAVSEEQHRWIKNGRLIDWRKQLVRWWNQDRATWKEKTPVKNGAVDVEQLEAECEAEQDPVKRRQMRKHLEALQGGGR